MGRFQVEALIRAARVSIYRICYIAPSSLQSVPAQGPPLAIGLSFSSDTPATQKSVAWCGELWDRHQQDDCKLNA